MPFFQKDYFKADLSRVCDYEELVPEWYWLDLDDATSRE